MKTREQELIDSLAAVMTLANSMIDQVATTARIYNDMPGDVKKKIAEAQIKKELSKNHVKPYRKE